MPVTYEDAYNGLVTFLSTFRAKMPAETVQLVTNIYNKHSLEKAGKGGVLPVGPTKPNWTMVLKLINTASSPMTYAVQNSGPSGGQTRRK